MTSERTDGRVEVRTMPVTREQIRAVGRLASVASRIGGPYEVYGGVNIREELAHITTLDGAWWDARDSARLEEGHEPTPEEA